MEKQQTFISILKRNHKTQKSFTSKRLEHWIKDGTQLFLILHLKSKETAFQSDTKQHSQTRIRMGSDTLPSTIQTETTYIGTL